MKVIRMKTDSNQPASVYATAKIHMFENLEDITVPNFVISLIRLEHLRTMRQKLYQINIIITYYFYHHQFI